MALTQKELTNCVPKLRRQCIPTFARTCPAVESNQCPQDKEPPNNELGQLVRRFMKVEPARDGTQHAYDGL